MRWGRLEAKDRERHRRQNYPESQYFLHKRKEAAGLLPLLGFLRKYYSKFLHGMMIPAVPHNPPPEFGPLGVPVQSRWDSMMLPLAVYPCQPPCHVAVTV